MRRKAAAFPADFSVEPLRRIWTIRQFDEAYTAPHHGFRDATDYYHRASAMRVLDRIAVPTLILTAENDPFVPPEPVHGAASSASNPHITTIVTPRGRALRVPGARVRIGRGPLRRVLGRARSDQVCGRHTEVTS